MPEKPKKDTFDPDVDPSVILRAIETQQQLHKNTEARHFPRHFWCVPAALEIQTGGPSSTAPVRQLKVATNNISEGGFGFIIDGKVPVGSTVRVQFDSLPKKPRISGVVRSCVYLCGTQHRIGVEFVK
jgi:hypothetical protein